MVGLMALSGCDDGDGDPAVPQGGEAGEGGAGGGVMLPEIDLTGLTAVNMAPQSAVLLAGATKQFTAVGAFENGENKDLTAIADWSSTNPAVVSISNEPGSKGLATVISEREVSLTVSVGGFTNTLDFGQNCEYPEFPGGIVLGQVVPPVRWSNAYVGNGTSVEQREFGFDQIFCDQAQWGHVRTLVVVLGAGWCGACTAMAQRLSADPEALTSVGAYPIFLEFEDENSEPADTEYAQRHLGRFIGNAIGARVGDLDAEPASRIFGNSGIINGALPTVVVVRTSDMRIIYDSNRVEGPVRLQDVIERPDEDWTMGDPEMYRSNCQADGEEAGEPNDVAASATPLLPMGSVRGGICNENPDFFRIEEAGDWKLTLNFSHATGDLDVYVWDVEEDAPFTDAEGNPIGAATLSDNEAFEWSGPAIIRIAGHDFASAGYLLTLQSL
ncbi:MAG: hypothetical protein ACI9U2_004090 [Bradymonadia bacterium]